MESKTNEKDYPTTISVYNSTREKLKLYIDKKRVNLAIKRKISYDEIINDLLNV